MAARKPNHPLQRYEKRAGARLCYLPPPTPRAGTRSRTSISAVSIRAFEKGGDMRESNLRLLTLTFEAAGIIFQADGEVTGGGIGVRLRSSIDDA